MKRRDFLRAAGGTAAAATAVAGNAAAQQATETGTATTETGSTETGTAGGNETGTAGGTGAAGTGTAETGTAGGGGGGGGLPGSGVTKTVEVGPGGSLVFTPGTDEPLQIAPGTTVQWVWKSDNHNVIPNSIPDGTAWEGSGPKTQTFNTGHTYTHTFTKLGTYEYHCQPHQSAGMVGTIEVVENPNAGGGEKDLEDLGVPIQAHYVGSGAILGILATVIYTFYIVKYGESPNTGNTGGGEEE